MRIRRRQTNGPTREATNTSAPAVDDVTLTRYLTAGWPVWRIASTFGMSIPEVRSAIGAAVSRGAADGEIYGTRS